jgi:hypothetical protein
VNESEQQNLEKLQQELASLLEKKNRRELSRLDVQNIIYLELLLNGTLDEVDNYRKYLAPGAELVLHEKHRKDGAQ